MWPGSRWPPTGQGLGGWGLGAQRLRAGRQLDKRSWGKDTLLIVPAATPAIPGVPRRPGGTPWEWGEFGCPGGPGLSGGKGGPRRLFLSCRRHLWHGIFSRKENTGAPVSYLRHTMRSAAAAPGRGRTARPKHQEPVPLPGRLRPCPLAAPVPRAAPSLLSVRAGDTPAVSLETRAQGLNAPWRGSDN